MKPTASSSNVYGQARDETIVSRIAEIDGVKLHYMTAGQDTPLILLDGLRGDLADGSFPFWPRSTTSDWKLWPGGSYESFRDPSKLG